jgi:hypothetical protein
VLEGFLAFQLPLTGRGVVCFHHETPLLERILEPVTRSLNPEAARSLLKVRADATAQKRVAELAEKCNEGTLSEAERSEYDMYIWAGKIVALLQANARTLLVKGVSEPHSR